MRSAQPRWPYTLRQLPLFAQCSKSELEAIASQFTQIGLKAGTVLVREGDVGREFYVIVEGSAAVSVGGQIAAQLGAGDFVGEMALLNHAPRSATVVALTDLTVYVSNPREFSALLDIAPTVAAQVSTVASLRKDVNQAA
jgi:CRP/FNR family cyclic AMP-dependent transcriptional regulator